MSNDGTAATLATGGKEISLPLVQASEGNNGYDVSKLLKETGNVTLDTGSSTRPPAAAPSPTSTATRASCATAATPSSSLPRSPASSRSPTSSSTASCRPRTSWPTSSSASAATRSSTRTSRRSSAASPATRTRCRSSPRPCPHCPPSTRTASTLRQGAGRDLDGPPHGEAADDRGLRVQEERRPAVPLPRQLAVADRELPADDRVPGRALRPRPRHGQGARPAAHPARRPRAELLHLDRAGGSSQANLLRRSRPASTRSSVRCTVGRTSPSSRCSTGSRPTARRRRLREEGQEQGRRREAHGLRAPRLQELRPARRSSRRPRTPS